MRTTLVSIGVVLVVGAVLMAQTVTTYMLKVYSAGGATALSTTAIPAAAFTCNLSVKPVAAPVNPASVALNDPSNAGKWCQWTDAPGGPVIGKPAGSYELTLTASNAAGAAAESTRAPFSQLAVPTVATGVFTAQ